MKTITLSSLLATMCVSIATALAAPAVQDPQPPVSGTPRPPETVYEAKVFTGANGKTLPYRQLSPTDPAAEKRYPLVLFLHGAGNRGVDNKLQLQWVLPVFATAENLTKHPCFVIAPQCPIDKRWVEVDWGSASHTMPAEPSGNLALSLELIDQAVKTLPVDPSRIYVCGLSMGGYGTWDAISRRPDFFAAAIPVCGGADLAQAAKLTKIPIWAFHGGKDPVVKPARTTGMIEAITKAGGHPKMTIYPAVQHDSWIQAFNDPATLDWLFEQHRVLVPLR
ncbi:MAG: prolyl oligopeptidase family serine peptidase [Luteolibacter sp.]